MWSIMGLSGYAVIPGRAQREPQMRNCASGNLEIPDMVLRTIPE
jgi:hypothetical protein